MKAGTQSVFRSVSALAVTGLCSLIWSSVMSAEPSAPSIVDIKASSLDSTKLEKITDVPFWTVKAGQGARASGVSAFKSGDRKFDAGVSQYEKVTLELRDWPVDEFMYILEGQVEITDANGHSKTYGPGDAFVMPKGFHGKWRQLSKIRKINISYGGPLE